LAGNLLKTYLKIRIHILGSGKLERAFRAFICATGDLCRPLRAESVCTSERAFVTNGPQNLPPIFRPKRIIQRKIFQNNNLDMTEKGLAKYGGRGPKIAVVINGQSSNFFVWR
jgi:hypothetical protein